MPTEIKKTTSIYTRVTPELKAQAETVLNQLQIPMSTALNMFLQQVVIQRKIPFEIKLPDLPLNYDNISKADFDAAIQKGLDQHQTFSSAQIRAEMTEDN
ncbi:type II toxin-antitoxin system RelB/DinJ family antitoxin [Lactiplantibacillus daoliensis]|uniref:Type II toxin-antitoxin system RelB/DinJ family antitoxin n=1 Tax=Lactiplantibacillus daoliensis TaxID=2559916 RepID=A0ABW1UDM5_9LACO|nr:type II toxin-antitoxin system RelB/DinJ family antitoxin [Lactiplantibacillus daoliensis]